MKYIRLVYKEDSEGQLGLSVKGTPMINYPMAATEGLLIAHDILEHQNGIKNIGSLGDELEALGGIWYVRGSWGDLRRDSVGSAYSPEESLASDVMNMAMIYNTGIPLRVNVPKTYKCGVDDSFISIIEIAKKSLRHELDLKDIDESRIREYFDSVLVLLRVGYRKASRRFRDKFIANNMFWAIAEEVDNILKYAEYKGQEFILGYSSSEVYSREVEEYEYY